jgi:hypothetical protein
MVKILATLTALMVGSTPAFAQLRWCWRFAAGGVSAAGTITTGKRFDGKIAAVAGQSISEARVRR